MDLNIQKDVISELDIIRNIKGLAIDMIDAANSGHPGIVLSASPILYTLFAHHLIVNPNDTTWLNRDRFIMSAGHGSALLYSIMYFSGYPLTIDDLKHFRRVGYKTPGHPEYNVTPGVDMSTGPLGQGIASAVGMALSGKILNEKYKLTESSKLQKSTSVFDYNVYVLCGDGDLMEGVSYEAASFAGSLNLNNLIVLYDSNDISLDGDTNKTFTEDVRKRFEALGWHTDLVKNGNSVDEISKAISKAKDINKPSLIEIKTIIGEGTKYAGTSSIHGKPLSKDEVFEFKRSLNLSPNAFEYSDFLRQDVMKKISTRSIKRYEEWSKNYKTMKDGFIVQDDFIFQKNEHFDLTKNIFNFSNDYKEELRNTNQEIMNTISRNVPGFIGGSADLSSSAKTYLENGGDISIDSYNHKNIWYGVREHAMASIMNGISLSHFKTYCSTFLTFSDYMKPAMRLSALMGINPTYIFTHDSVSIGPDGPTHQPIEQLSSIRMIPNMYVFRPADANELIGSWNYILNSTGHPNSLVVTKDKVDILPIDSNLVSNGAYIVKKEDKNLHGILLATGSEVHTALRVAKELKEKDGLDLRVVSMPCMELYELQPDIYKEQLLPKGIRVIAIEAGSSAFWYKYVYNKNYLITIDNFGISGTKDEVLNHCNFSYNNILKRVKNILK